MQVAKMCWLFCAFCKTASGKRHRGSVMEPCTVILSRTEFVCISVSCVNCLYPPNMGSIESTKLHRAGRPAKHTIVLDCTILPQNITAIRIICISLHMRSPVPLEMRQASLKVLFDCMQQMQQPIMSSSGKKKK